MTLRKRVYIACPITKGDPTANAERADEAMFALMSAGFAVLNPALTMWAGAAKVLIDNREQEAMPYLPAYPSPTAHGRFRLIAHHDWVANCLPWVACADAVYRVPGESTGADQECVYARGLNIPVFESLEDLFRHFAPPPPARAEVADPHPLAWGNH